MTVVFIGYSEVRKYDSVTVLFVHSEGNLVCNASVKQQSRLKANNTLTQVHDFPTRLHLVRNLTSKRKGVNNMQCSTKTYSCRVFFFQKSNETKDLGDTHIDPASSLSTFRTSHLCQFKICYVCRYSVHKNNDKKINLTLNTLTPLLLAVF